VHRRLVQAGFGKRRERPLENPVSVPSRRIAVRTNPRGYRRGEIPHRPSLSTDLLAPVHAGRVADFQSISGT
jgi:hypothetical protein